MKQNNLITNCMYCEQAFSEAECQQIIAMQTALLQAPVYDYHTGGQIYLDKNNPFRRSLCQELTVNEENEWLYDKIWSIFQGINSEHYHFHLENMSMVQLLKYESGDFFNWHMDLGPGELSTRKLTMVLHLSKPKDYLGGELLWNPGFGNIPQTQGTFVVFPAYIPHTVKPIIQGTRYTLVAWANGDAFI